MFYGTTAPATCTIAALYIACATILLPMLPTATTLQKPQFRSPHHEHALAVLITDVAATLAALTWQGR